MYNGFHCDTFMYVYNAFGCSLPYPSLNLLIVWLVQVLLPTFFFLLFFFSSSSSSSSSPQLLLLDLMSFIYRSMGEVLFTGSWVLYQCLHLWRKWDSLFKEIIEPKWSQYSGSLPNIKWSFYKQRRLGHRGMRTWGDEHLNIMESQSQELNSARTLILDFQLLIVGTWLLLLNWFVCAYWCFVVAVWKS